MYSKQHIEEELIRTFRHQEVIRRDELWAFAHQLNPQIKAAQFNYILLDLKKKGKLHDIGKGIYTTGVKEAFRPEPNDLIRKLAAFATRITESENNYCIWSTAWLNEFIELQATAIMYILEVDKMDLERVFFSLRDVDDKTFTTSFLHPDRTVIENYVAGLHVSFVVWPLITRAPVETHDNLSFPTLEKILVDLFFAYQGVQLIHIFEAAFSKYPINFSRLFAYAQRRNRKEELQAFLLQHTITQTTIPSTKK